MHWNPPLEEAVLKSRYKRFLSDVVLNHESLVAHVPNTGSMVSCWAPDWKCALSKSTNPDRKLPYTLELTHNGDSWIMVNTGLANKLVKEWLTANLLPAFQGYQTIIPEQKIGDSRVDFYLENHPTLPPCYIEVKNVTLKKDGLALFPDTVSTRGQKHLEELMRIKRSGLRAAMLYVVGREDVDAMRPAHECDPNYGKLLLAALESGVEIFVHQCRIDLKEITLGPTLPFRPG